MGGDIKPERGQRRQRVLKARHTATLGVIGVDGAVGPALQDGCNKPRERPFRAALDEDASAVGVHPLHLSDPFHGGGDLLRQDVDDLGARVRAIGVIAAGHVGGDRPLRRPDVETLKHRLQRRRGRGHNAGVKRVTHGQRVHGDAPRDECLDRRLDRLRRTGDDGLRGAVFVGRHNVPGDLRQHLLDLVHAGCDPRHPALVVDLNPGHLPTPGTDRHQRITEAQNARRDRRRVLAQGVPRHHVRKNPVRGQQPQDRHVDGQRGRLRDLRVPKPLELLFFGNFGVASDEITKGSPKFGRHHFVRFIKRRRDNRVHFGQVQTHVDVLRSLAGEQKRHFAVVGRFLDVNAPPAQQLRRTVLSQHLQRPLNLIPTAR